MVHADPGEWACEAYPPEAAEYGVRCFFADRGTRNCATVEECAASVDGARKVLSQRMAGGALHPGEGFPFPFPLAEPSPPPVMVTRPCGCTSMDTGDDGPPVQVSWCDEHDPGYEP